MDRGALMDSLFDPPNDSHRDAVTGAVGGAPLAERMAGSNVEVVHADGRHCAYDARCCLKCRVTEIRLSSPQY